MDRIPLEVASKIITLGALSKEDLCYLSHTNQLLRYAALPKLWNVLDIAIKVECDSDSDRMVWDTGRWWLPERKLRRFSKDLPHLHAFVERVSLKLDEQGHPKDQQGIQGSLTSHLRILADLLPTLPSLREFQWREGQFETFGPEASAAALTVLVVLLRSEVTKITVFGSLLSFLAKPLFSFRSLGWKGSASATIASSTMPSSKWRRSRTPRSLPRWIFSATRP